MLWQLIFGMTSWRPFCTFSSGHSHGRSFTLIFFKISDEIENYLPLFAFENPRYRLVTSTNMADGAFEKKNGRQNIFFWTRQVRCQFLLILNEWTMMEPKQSKINYFHFRKVFLGQIFYITENLELCTYKRFSKTSQKHSKPKLWRKIYSQDTQFSYHNFKD